MATPLLVRPESPPSCDGGLSRLVRAARNNRDRADAQQDCGLALGASGQLDAALPYLLRARDLEPTNPDHEINLSAAYHRAGEWSRAYRHAETAHRLDLGNPLATNNLAALHMFWGEIEESVRWYEATIRLAPDRWDAWACWIFALDLMPITAEDALAARRNMAAHFEPQIRSHWFPHRNAVDPERRLRVGFTGGDFRDHSAAWAFGPIFEHLDRDQFQAIIYADLTTRDQVTDWFQAAANGWRDVTGWPDEMIAQVVRRDEIDVLVDLAGFTDKSHLYVHALKPAPLSLTAWGHLTGTGFSDGILVDPIILPPEHASQVVEQPCYVPYALGVTPPRDHVEIRPKAADSPLVFGYLGRLAKLCDPTVALWSRVLHRYPESRLILKEGALRQERALLRTLARFAAHGIGADRLDIRYSSPRPDHLATCNEIDVLLDPISQGGGTTTLEGLWMGTPTVTLLGGRTVNRASASTLMVAGQPEWVAATPDEYVALAGQIGAAGGPHLRDELMGSPVCDDAARTRAFEDAVRGLWRGWCQEQREAA